MRRCLLCLASFVLALGCDGEIDSPDSGMSSGLDGGDGAVLPACERAEDCEDGIYCTEHRCEPGSTDADARGCVRLEDAPCTDDMRCVESERRCVPADCAGTPDADGDGRDAVACGGDDCDDFDPARFPGNTEVCDVDGHDEDCDPSTFGDTDLDADGYVDAECCNGGRCANDCDDGNRAIAPGETESCDGVDEDCDGAVDESSGPLCPGGVCVAGRCDLRGWDRTFGGDTNEDIIDAALDSAGNVYVMGEFRSTLFFASDSVEPRGAIDVFVASYSADGSFRWVLRLGTSGDEYAGGMVHHRGSNQVVVHVSSDGDDELTAGVSAGRATTLQSAFLIAIDEAGAVRWHRETFAGVDAAVTAGPLAANDDIIVATSRLGGGSFFEDESTEPRTISEARTFIATYASSGAPDTRFDAGTAGFPRGVAVDRAGNAYLAALGGGVASFDADGSLRWQAVAAAPVSDVAVSDDRVFAVGGFDEPVDLGSGSPAGASGAGANGFIVALAHDGSYVNATTWEWDAGAIAAVTVDSRGAPILAGFFQGDVELGGGPRRSTDGGSLFYLALDSGLVHQSDSAFAAPTCATADFCPSFAYDIAVGPADSTAIVGSFAGSIDLGSGPRISVGSLDGFVVRLAN